MDDQSISTTGLLHLRKELPHGSIKKIASILHLTPAYVSGVLSGKYLNIDVIQQAIKVRDEHRTMIKTVKSQL
jgi:predicted transcriptional regulator